MVIYILRPYEGLAGLLMILKPSVKGLTLQPTPDKFTLKQPIFLVTQTFCTNAPNFLKRLTHWPSDHSHLLSSLSYHIINTMHLRDSTEDWMPYTSEPMLQPNVHVSNLDTTFSIISAS